MATEQKIASTGMAHADLMQSYQEDLYSMLDSLRQLEGHLRNIQARTFEMTEEISYLISDNLRLLGSVNDQVANHSDEEPHAPNTPLAPPAPWKKTERANSDQVDEP
ncbi:hypothetical protein CEP52_014775 [Fusarium oligoseptatum]|uniref:Uncharacterized protein n=1 Tax=Fusarium oligoseptatum TaxID=2604345 RepID=A0A428SJC1_9HYPO|nr:hypothetical protein CEP52_014775 [Fusarium oligoseptatum]